MKVLSDPGVGRFSSRTAPPAPTALLHGWDLPQYKKLGDGKGRRFKKKELLEIVKARFALDPEQSDDDEPRPKRRRYTEASRAAS